MSHIIRLCLDQLQSLPVDEAIAPYVPAEGDSKISSFARAIIETPAVVEARDLTALTKIYDSDVIEEDVKNRIFSVCIKVGLSSEIAEDEKNRIADLFASSSKKEKDFTLGTLNEIAPLLRTADNIKKIQAIYLALSALESSGVSDLEASKRVLLDISIFDFSPGSTEFICRLCDIIVALQAAPSEERDKLYHILLSANGILRNYGLRTNFRDKLLSSSSSEMLELLRLSLRAYPPGLANPAGIEDRSSPPYFFWTFQSLKSFPSEERSLLVEAALPVTSIMLENPQLKAHEISLVYSCLGIIPKEQRAAFLHEIIYTNLEGFHFSDFSASFGRMTEEQKHTLLIKAAPFFAQGVRGLKERVELLSCMSMYPSNMDSGLIEDVIALTSHSHPSDVHRTMLQLIPLSKENRESLMVKMRAFLADSTESVDVAFIICVLRSSEAEKIEDTLHFLSSLHEILPSLPARIGPLHAMMLLPVLERERLLHDLAPVLRGVNDPENTWRIVKLVADQPLDRREKLVAAVTPYITEDLGEDGRYILFSGIASIPQEEWEPLKDLAPQILAFSTQPNTRAGLLEALVGFPHVLRGEILQCIQSNDSPDFDKKHLRDVLIGLKRFPEDSIFDMLPKLMLLSSRLPEILKRMNYSMMIEFIALLPLEEASQMLDLMTTLAPSVALSDFWPIHIVHLLYFIPPDQRESAVSALYTITAPEDDPVKTFARLLEFISEQVPGIKDTILNSLRAKLQSRGDPNQQNLLARMIITYHNEFNLSDEHPMIQLAIAAICNTDPDAMSNPKNPYALFDALGKADKEKVELSQRAISFTPLLAEAEKLRQATTFATLPSGIGPDTLNQLIQAFDQRIFVGAAQTTEEQEDLRSTTLMYIRDNYGFSYEDVRREYLLDPFLPTLLNVSGRPEELVPRDAALFYAILKHIMDLPGTVEEGKILSPREEAFIGMLGQIRHCPGGKKEGIFLYYQLMKERRSDIESLAQNEVEKLVYDVVYKTLASLLSDDNAFMRELTSATTPEISQLSHQAIFVKNLIGKKTGLIWDLFFDQHTHVLYDKLVMTRPQQAIDKLLQHFCLAAVTKNVQHAINLALAEADSRDRAKKESANLLYHKLYECLGNDESCFLLDDDSGSLTITTTAAIKLIAIFGYCKSLDAFTLLSEIKESTKNLEHVRMLVEALGSIDEGAQRAIFDKMELHHRLTGKKSVELEDYGRAAFLGTNAAITVSEEDRKEVMRQVLIEYTLQHLLSNLSTEKFSSALARLQAVDSELCKNLYLKMHLAMQESGHSSAAEPLSTAEAAFKDPAGSLTDKQRAIVLLIRDFQRDTPFPHFTDMTGLPPITE